MLILNRPCRPGEDVHDSVLHITLASMEDVGKYQKREAKATKAGVIWFVDEDAVVQHILEIISRDEIAMDVTYQEAREHDNLKEGRATKRRRRDGPSSQAPMASTGRNATKGVESTVELFVGEEVLRAGLTSLRASFTVSPQGEYLGCFWFLWFVCWGGFCCFFVPLGIPFFWSIAFDAQRRHPSKTVTIVMMSAAQEQKKRMRRRLSQASPFVNLLSREFRVGAGQ